MASPHLTHSLSSCLPDPAHTPRGEGTGGAPHQKGDVKRENGTAIIPAVAPACPGGIRDPGKPNSRCHGLW